MRSTTFIISLLFTLAATQVSAQQKAVRPGTIHFKLTDYNNMAVQAVLNRQDTVLLMFHTAANFLTLTEEGVKKLKTIQFSGTTDSIKSWGGQGNTARFSKNNTLQIAGLRWDSVTLWENKNSGQYTDGKFGLDLFEKRSIEIDFDKNIIVLRDDIPEKAAGFEKLALRIRQEDLFVEANCIIGDKHFSRPFLLHSGYSGALLLDDQFARENKLASMLTITDEKQLKDSYGNIVKVKKSILPRFQLGSQILYNVPAGFFEGAIGAQKMSILGGDVLKRFNIIIDAARAYLYIKSNHLGGAVYSNY